MIIEYNFQIIRKVNSEKFIRVKKDVKTAYEDSK